jgi:hypothetical protein
MKISLRAAVFDLLTSEEIASSSKERWFRNDMPGGRLVVKQLY